MKIQINERNVIHQSDAVAKAKQIYRQYDPRHKYMYTQINVETYTCEYCGKVTAIAAYRGSGNVRNEECPLAEQAHYARQLGLAE